MNIHDNSKNKKLFFIQFSTLSIFYKNGRSAYHYLGQGWKVLLNHVTQLNVAVIKFE